MIKTAMAYTKQNGYRPPLAIFPLAAKNKVPAISKEKGGHGCLDATTDEKQIMQWWKQYPNANIGIATGGINGIVVIDCDNHPEQGKYGDEDLAELETKYGKLPPSWEVLTGSGGRHLFFKIPNDCVIPCSEGDIANAVDVRGHHGYVVAAGSVHPNGNLYEWELSSLPNETPLADLPAAWREFLTASTKQVDNARFDLPETIGEGERNDTLFRYAASLRGQKIAPTTILERLQTANRCRCVKPLSGAEIETIFNSAMKYAEGSTEFVEKDIPKLTKSAFDSFGFYCLEDLTDEERTPPEFIVEGMIPTGMTFLSGAPKLRKSFLALQMAAAVATGSDFLGHKTNQCSVAYLDLEGSKSRISTRADRMRLTVPRNVYITNDSGAKISDGLTERIRALHHQKPEIKLIIVDTFSRARGTIKATGANAYDADVQLLEPIQRMAMDEKIAVVFVHHDKKGANFAIDTFERLSGTMGISGSADSVLNLIADGKRFDGKAMLEYTPRDAKGGEMKLVFNERFCEWEIETANPDALLNDCVIRWILDHTPNKNTGGEFFDYDTAFRGAYNRPTEKPGDAVRTAILKHRNELFSQYGIAVQTGVKSNSTRGIRIVKVF